MKININYLGLVLGPTFSILLFLLLPYDMGGDARLVASVTCIMAVWWITEAIPIPVTSLLPIVLFPSLGLMNGSEVTPNYSNHLVYLFLGGFLIGAAIEKSNLHYRIALNTINITGTSPSRVILGFMVSSAFLSMWISNTATAMIMFTIATAFLLQIKEKASETSEIVSPAFGTALMLSIAYACSIGGTATLVGTPSNGIMAGVFENTYGVSVNFLDWMMFALPLALVMLVLIWALLIHFKLKSVTELPIEKDWVKDKINELGAMKTIEKRTLIVCLLVVTGWLLRGFTDWAIFDLVKDSTIAIAGAILLFIIPAGDKSGSLLDWESASKIPWDILLLFGGGFALAAGFVESGLIVWLATKLNFLQGAQVWLVVLCIVTMVIYLTEITSNTATAAILLPISVSVAQAMDANPLAFMAAASIAANYAFMLPVATPPNAIVFSSRLITIRQMAGVGFFLNLIGVLFISAYTVYAVNWFFS